MIDVETGDFTRPVPYESGVGGAAWSPDGRRIALIRNDQLITVDPRGRGLRILGPSVSGRPLVWSRDGTRIVYGAGRRLFSVSAAGGAPRRFATLPPRWRAVELR